MQAMLSRLRAADADRDGSVTRQEFAAQAEKQFARLDRNGDGVADQADRDLLGKQMADYRVLRFLHRFGAGQDGKVHVEFSDPMLKLDGAGAIIGRGVIVHANPDDLKTQPTGNAGGRQACAVIGVAKP